MDVYKRFCFTMQGLGYGVPKQHLMFHLIMRSEHFGCPLLYSTWLDESLNRVLKRVLRLCSQQNFELLAFAKMGEALRRAQG